MGRSCGSGLRHERSAGGLERLRRWMVVGSRQERSQVPELGGGGEIRYGGKIFATSAKILPCTSICPAK